MTREGEEAIWSQICQGKRCCICEEPFAPPYTQHFCFCLACVPDAARLGEGACVAGTLLAGVGRIKLAVAQATRLPATPLPVRRCSGATHGVRIYSERKAKPVEACGSETLGRSGHPLVPLAVLPRLRHGRSLSARQVPEVLLVKILDGSCGRLPTRDKLNDGLHLGDLSGAQHLASVALERAA